MFEQFATKSPTRLRALVKRELDVDIPLATVRKFLEAQNVVQIHRVKQNRNSFIRYAITKPDTLHQCDILYLDEVNGFVGVLGVIDAASRKFAVHALKDRSASTIVAAFKVVYKKELRPPKTISHDAGSEFDNKEVREYLTSIGTKQKVLEPRRHAHFIESAFRSFSEVLYSTRDAKVTKQGAKARDWPKIYKKMVARSNSLNHSKTRLPPNEAYEMASVPQNYTPLRKEEMHKPAFKIGDLVRVRLPTVGTRRAVDARWSDERYEIFDIMPYSLDPPQPNRYRAGDPDAGYATRPMLTESDMLLANKVENPIDNDLWYEVFGDTE